MRWLGAIAAVAIFACGRFDEAVEPATDAGTDAGTADGGPSPSGDGGACSARRCYTFDENPTAPLYSFDAVRTDRSGTVALSSDQWTSPFALLKVDGTAGGAGYAWGATILGAPPKQIRTSFLLKTVQFVRNGDPSAHFLWLGCSGGGDGEVYFKLGTATILDLKQNLDGGLAPQGETIPPLDAFTRMVVQYDRIAGGGYTISAELAGTKHFEGLAATQPFACNQLELRHGIASSDPKSATAKYTLAFDDILVDWN